MRDLKNLDWGRWKPKERCTLIFLFQGDQILLIHKKTKLGAGLINAPGGKMERGETPEQCAIRECHEEVGLIPIRPVHCGTLKSAFANGFDLQVDIFASSDFEGTMIETDEADPFWQNVDEIPYVRMWPDSFYWLPHILENRSFVCLTKLDDKKLVEVPTITSWKPVAPWR